jgi:hypothetical protein
LDPFSFVMSVIAAVGGGIVAGAIRRGENSRAVSWRQRAADCGLTDVETGARFLLRGFLKGRYGRHAVRIERFKRGKSSRGTRVVVTGLAPDVNLKGEGLGSTIEKAMGARDIEIGEEAFDAELFVQGPPALVRALLDAGTRRLVLDLFRGRVPMKVGAPRDIGVSVNVAHGELRAEFPDGFMRANDEPHSDTLRCLLALAERLAPVGALERRLVAIARDDPHPRVRGRALTTLEREYPAALATREAMMGAIRDAHPEVRLQAALWLRPEGLAVLEALATSEDVPDSCSARALAGLGSGLDLARTCSILDAALRAGRLETARTALASLGLRGAAGVEALARCLDGARDEDVAVAAAHALGSTSSALAEEPLLRALERGPDALRLAAARALGHVGTARAVMPLKDLQEHARGETDKASREAVARIQSRLTGATPGQLAIAEDGSGHVSLSDDPSGRVTLPEE